MCVQKCLCVLFFFWLHMESSANKVIPVGAIVETNTHLWVLDTIWTCDKSSFFQWTVKSKTQNSKIILNKDYKLINCDTGVTYCANRVYSSVKTPYSTFPVENVYMSFPGVPDSTSMISIYQSPSFYVDSIISVLTPGYGQECKYHVPLYNYKNINSLSDSIKYVDHLYKEGIDYYEKKNYYRAILTFEKELAFEYLIYRTSKERFYRLSSTKDWLAHCYYMVGQVNKAKKYGYDYVITPYNKMKTRLADSLYCFINIENDNITERKRISIYERISQLYLAELGATSYRYAKALYDLGDEYSNYNEFEKAKKSYYTAIDILEKIDKNLSLLEGIYESLYFYAYDNEDFASATKYIEKYLMVKRDTFKIVSDEVYGSGYDRLVDCLVKTGKLTKAIMLQKRRVDYWREQFVKKKNEESYTHIRSGFLNNINLYIQLLHLTENDKMIIREIRRIIDENEKYHANIEDISNYLAPCYYNLGDYSKALKYYGTNEKEITAKIYEILGEYDKSIKLQKQLVNSWENVAAIALTIDLNHSSGPYNTCLSNLARTFNLSHQYDSALVYENKHRGMTQYEMANSYYNIGVANAGKRQWKKAIYAMRYASSLFKLQKRTRQYVESQKRLALFYYMSNSLEQLKKSVAEIMNLSSKNYYSMLKELTYNERSLYIETYSDIMSRQIPLYAYYTNSDILVATAFNACLMMKGALLSSEKSVRRIIKDSGDNTINALWERMKSYRAILKQKMNKQSQKSKSNIDMLQNVVNRMEDSLVMKCKEYGDITQGMKLKWQDIRSSLHTEDLAVEILNFPVNNDSIVYVAMTLRKDYQRPKMIYLFDEKQLKEVLDTITYNCEDMAALVWKPLFEELYGIKNIYFSPSGALYNIGIEYLPGMENYNLYRLSSTRELVTRTKMDKDKHAVLYGGLDYYAGLDPLASNQKISITDEFFIDHADVRGMKMRGGKELLPQTKIEVEQIGKELKNALWDYALLTGDNGTEESFKSLSGKKVNTMHISTHGFYYTPEEADKMNYDFLRLDNRMASTEDKALTRSGLIMSGANHILEGEELPDNVEDGILTAKEIADVDLRGLDLVVLSACQTGLGDISQGEGVFGLQRGFKKAGAKTILMSLWEVDDKATQILMTQFYKNFLAGQSKRQSLLSAQKYLREVENGKYNDPKYWASFILLDGLDI